MRRTSTVVPVVFLMLPVVVLFALYPGLFSDRTERGAGRRARLGANHGDDAGIITCFKQVRRFR
jgi:hypothetical protein